MDTRVAGVASILTLIILNFSSVSCQKSRKLYPPIKKDVPFIKCDVCKKGVKYLYLKAESMRDETDAKKVEEEKFQELVEKACNPDKFEGEWIAKLDIEEEGGKLVITEHKDLGLCKAECRTVAMACEDTLGEADVDVAEELWKDEKSLSKLINQVCYLDTNACSENRVKFKSATRKNEIFEIMSEEEKKAHEYMKRASDMPGMPKMQMYSRKEMEEMANMQSEQKVPSDDHNANDKSNTSQKDQRTGGILWQTIRQVFKDIWQWIVNVIGLAKRNTKEL